VTIWLTADLHFNHPGVRKYCPWRWEFGADVRDMNEGLLALIRQHVRPHDQLWIVGDFGFHAPRIAPLDDLFHRLPGAKYLVAGNHDEENKPVLRLPWMMVRDLVYLRHDRERAILCHYPLETWRNASGGSIHLHGHCHGTLRNQRPHRFDVGIDVWRRPVTLDEMFEAARAQGDYEPVDHHGVARPDALACAKVLNCVSHDPHVWLVGNDHSPDMEPVACPGFPSKGVGHGG
jgi:calcineurin-like phosphoesterase family protein